MTAPIRSPFWPLSGVTVSSTERSSPPPREIIRPRRPTVTFACVVRHWRTGSPSERRSFSSTSVMMSVMRLAQRVDRLHADELLAGLVHVVDATAHVRGDDALAQRIERLPGASGGRARRRCGRRRAAPSPPSSAAAPVRPDSRCARPTARRAPSARRCGCSSTSSRSRPGVAGERRGADDRVTRSV